MKIVIDIDGVIGTNTIVDSFSNTQLFNMPININIIEKINEMYENGYWITIHTSRKECLRNVTEGWLIDNDVMYHELIMDKPTADFYLDDKSITLKEFMEL